MSTQRSKALEPISVPKKTMAKTDFQILSHPLFPLLTVTPPLNDSLILSEVDYYSHAIFGVIAFCGSGIDQNVGSSPSS